MKKIIKQVEKMSWQDILKLQGEINRIVEKKRQEKNQERFERYGNF